MENYKGSLLCKYANFNSFEVTCKLGNECVSEVYVCRSHYERASLEKIVSNVEDFMRVKGAQKEKSVPNIEIGDTVVVVSKGNTEGLQGVVESLEDSGKYEIYFDNGWCGYYLPEELEVVNWR